MQRIATKTGLLLHTRMAGQPDCCVVYRSTIFARDLPAFETTIVEWWQTAHGDRSQLPMFVRIEDFSMGCDHDRPVFFFCSVVCVVGQLLQQAARRVVLMIRLDQQCEDWDPLRTMPC